MNPLLIIANPRQIPECIEAFRALDVRRAWLSNYTEWELVAVMDSIMRDQSIFFSHAILCADDCVVSQGALDAVLAGAETEHAKEHDAAVTGYCRLDHQHPEVNITRRPLMGDVPVPGAYDFWRYDDVQEWPDPGLAGTGFVGFALTCMSRARWLQFPFGVFGGPQQSWSSDFHLSARLRDAGVEMTAARDGYVTHVKEQWQRLDTAHEKRLLIGEEPAGVVVEG